MNTQTAAEATLSIEIKNISQIELRDLTVSFGAFSNEFMHYIEMHDPEVAASNVRLYIHKIEAGSIIAILQAVAPFVLPLMTYTNTVLTFHKHLYQAYKYLNGADSERPNLDKISCQNLSSIVEPTAKDRGSQLIINASRSNVVVNITSHDANAIQNTARKEIEALISPELGLHEKVVLYWYQARADAASKAGDRGIIESISASPVKVICATDNIKAQMILDESNPFTVAYIVDVMVETIRGKPAVYKVLSVHDKIPISATEW